MNYITYLLPLSVDCSKEQTLLVFSTDGKKVSPEIERLDVTDSQGSDKPVVTLFREAGLTHAAVNCNTDQVEIMIAYILKVHVKGSDSVDINIFKPTPYTVEEALESVMEDLS